MRLLDVDIRKIPDERVQLTQAVTSVTGRHWCGYHQGFADGATGMRRGHAWMCRNCMQIRKIKT